MKDNSRSEQTDRIASIKHRHIQYGDDTLVLLNVQSIQDSKVGTST